MSLRSQPQKLPFLAKRCEIASMFASYIGYTEHAIYWETDRQLQKNLEGQQSAIAAFTADQDLADRDIAEAETATLLFWLHQFSDSQSDLSTPRSVQSATISFRHLAAYCEESCYEATRSLLKKSQGATWDEYLCTARALLYQGDFLVSLLSKYDATLASLKTYLQSVLLNQLRSQIPSSKQSRWRRLYKASDKELKEALEQAGHRERTRAQICFARKQFKPIYLMNKVKNPQRNPAARWPEADELDFSEAAQCYNAERRLTSAPHTIFVSAEEVNASTLQQWMETAMSALYHYAYTAIPTASLEALYEQKGFEPMATQSAPEAEENTSLPPSVSQDWRQQLQLFNVDYKRTLLLHYGLGWKQSQIATYLKINQGTVSRYLTNTKKQLAKDMGTVSQPEQWVSKTVTAWLGKHCPAPQSADLIEMALAEALRQLGPQQLEIIRQCYGAGLDIDRVSEQLGLSPDDVRTGLATVETAIEAYLIKKVTKWTQQIVHDWLKNYYNPIVQTLCGAMNISVPTGEGPEVADVLKEYLTKEED